ncbi:hypothetical protein V6N12_069020 [Hibiscus sabdariffa]|uniref:Reverse transcriptase zinc-binding domain-containing protein n=1 Tax=Hibiscus sabdariffa TaxID=183260 RepID=A0ABR2FCP8_9ROSI
MDGVLVQLYYYLRSCRYFNWLLEVGVIEDLFEENIGVWIRSIPLSSLDIHNELIWRHDGARAYTTKSGYHLLLDEHDIGSAVISDSLSCFYNMLWSTNLPAKILITMWWVVNNFIPTFANLQLRQLNVRNICPVCQHLNECVEHLFQLTAKTATSGVLGRNANGLIMAACSVSHRDVADAFIIEALACKQAVLFARDLGFSSVIIEGILTAFPSILFDEMLITPLMHLLESAGFSRILSTGLKKLLNIQLLWVEIDIRRIFPLPGVGT